MSVTAHQISNAANITYRQVDFWTRAGYLIPDAAPTFLCGTGYPRTYPLDQMRHAVVMADLTRVGFTPRAAHLVALAIEQDGAAELGPFTLTRATTGRDRAANPTGARTA
jgi:hypothetical protein